MRCTPGRKSQIIRRIDRPQLRSVSSRTRSLNRFIDLAGATSRLRPWPLNDGMRTSFCVADSSQPDSPASISVRQPVHSRYPAVARPPPSGIRRRIPVAITLYPSPPSGWVWDLPNISGNAIFNALLRTLCIFSQPRETVNERSAYPLCGAV
jgi:hypothetical protein